MCDPFYSSLGAWPVERPADWVEYVNEAQSAEEFEALRRNVSCGCPAWRG